MEIGTGLEPETAAKYKHEWKLYLSWSKRQGRCSIPGRDEPWTIKAIKGYLEWRGARNNVSSLHGIKSKLKHCSLCYDQLLPTQQGEGPTQLRKQMDLVLQDIAKRQ